MFWLLPFQKSASCIFCFKTFLVWEKVVAQWEMYLIHKYIGKLHKTLQSAFFLQKIKVCRRGGRGVCFWICFSFFLRNVCRHISQASPPPTAGVVNPSVLLCVLTSWKQVLYPTHTVLPYVAGNSAAISCWSLKSNELCKWMWSADCMEFSLQFLSSLW